MLEELALTGFCILAAVVGLAIAVWEAVSGRIFDIDGLWLTLISLTLAGVFGGALAWSFYTGEGLQMLGRLQKKAGSKEAPDPNLPKPT